MTRVLVGRTLFWKKLFLFMKNGSVIHNIFNNIIKLHTASLITIFLKLTFPDDARNCF